MVIGFTYYHTRNSKFANYVLGRNVEARVLKIAENLDIDGFTMLHGIGAWKGQTEPTIQLQVEGISREKAERFAVELKEAYKQDSVMLKTGRGVVFV